MTDEKFPREEQHPAETHRVSFIERNRISPVAFALISLLIVFILYQVLAGTLTVFVAGSKVTSENVVQHRWFTFAGQILFILLPTLLLARLLDPRFSSVFPWRMPKFGETLFAALGLFFLQQIFQIYLFFQDRIPLPREIRELVDPLKEMIEEMFRTLVSTSSVQELAVVVLVVAVTPAVIEELLFRGLIQSSFERAMKPLTAAVISGLIFGAFHFNPFALIPLMALGSYFGFLRMRSKSVVLAMTVHFLNNSLAIIVVHFRMDDKFILGGGTGIEPNVPAILAQLVLFILLFAMSFSSYLRLTAPRQQPPGRP